ncbi:hypothetical protein LIA77_05556 [Sarocladium implicatum]|nr:hypothetical protein LIA77_05556 [Sarocladium implicatum]
MRAEDKDSTPYPPHFALVTRASLDDRELWLTVVADGNERLCPVAGGAQHLDTAAYLWVEQRCTFVIPLATRLHHRIDVSGRHDES